MRRRHFPWAGCESSRNRHPNGQQLGVLLQKVSNDKVDNHQFLLLTLLPNRIGKFRHALALLKGAFAKCNDDVSMENIAITHLNTAAILSQLAREGRLAVVDSLKLESPKTKVLADKFKAMNLQSVMVIADEVDENLYLASRNLKNVFVVEPRYADPVSLVHYKKVLVTKGAIDKLKEMFA